MVNLISRFYRKRRCYVLISNQDGYERIEGVFSYRYEAHCAELLYLNDRHYAGYRFHILEKDIMEGFIDGV